MKGNKVAGKARRLTALVVASLLVVAMTPVTAGAATETVFSTDFESGTPGFTFGVEPGAGSNLTWGIVGTTARSGLNSLWCAGSGMTEPAYQEAAWTYTWEPTGSSHITIQIQVTGQKDPRSPSATVDIDAFHVVSDDLSIDTWIEEDGLDYTGTWTSYTDPNNHGGAGKRSSSAGATATFTIPRDADSDTTLSWVAQVGNGGIATVYSPPGVPSPIAEVNFYATTYRNNMKAYAQHTVDLRNYSDANLSFYYNVPSIDPWGGDFGTVRIRRQGETSWYPLWFVTTQSAPTPGWIQATITNPNPPGNQIPIPLKDYVGSVVELQWYWGTDAGGIAEGMYIDDISVTGTRGPSDTTPPATPTGLAATAGDGSAALSWNANAETDLAGYYLYRSTTSSGGYARVGGLIDKSQTSYTDTPLTNGTTYYYKISAIDQSANESALSSYVWVVPGATGTFTDVAVNHWAYTYIEYLAGAGIVGGYPDGTFRPSGTITRAEFAKMVVLAAGETPNASYSGYFPDVAGGDYWAWPYIEKAKDLGLIQGYPDGTFRPNAKITRAEISKMVVLAAGYPTDTSGTPFPDVTPSHWAYSYIMTARANGVVGGYPDGTFRPSDSATRAEASKMIYVWVTGP